MTQTPPDPSQPPAPGWWLASDGNWYPPQPPAQPTPTYAQTPVQTPVPPTGAPKSNKGCLIALAVVGALLVLGGILTAVVIWKVADTVNDVAGGIQVGDVECPSDGKVSELIGYRVDLALSGSIVVASGCNYTSADGGGAGVAIVSGAGIIADEVLAEMDTEAANNGTETSSIDTGDDGKAYGSPTRSAAAAKADGHIVQVEIFSEGSEPIGNKKDQAEEILGMFIDLNY